MIRRLAVLLLLLCPGCSSLYDLAGGTERGPQIYGGVRTYPEYFEDMGVQTRGPGAWDNLVLIFAVGVIDLPVSLVGDTLLLPVTSVRELLRQDPPSPR